MTLENLFAFLKSLTKLKFTGKIVLHFHQGKFMKVTEQVEIKL